MQELLLFVFTYVFVFLIYEFIIVQRAKKNRKKKKDKKEPIEVSYLVRVYKMDLKKVDYNQLLQIIALVSSFDIAFTVSIIMIINIFFLQILIGFVSIIVLILVSYHLVYLFYKRKGMIQNEF